ncbi:hypothetical protein BaRGS_00004266 [Batillaria attramentaria]|uniref:Uncharacterized protein n=1 Tax=Batillaria attramentaria TaxID=370345 RepID=A0ABD0LXZ3_9CAEN
MFSPHVPTGTGRRISFLCQPHSPPPQPRSPSPPPPTPSPSFPFLHDHHDHDHHPFPHHPNNPLPLPTDRKYDHQHLSTPNPPFHCLLPPLSQSLPSLNNPVSPIPTIFLHWSLPFTTSRSQRVVAACVHYGRAPSQFAER